MRTIFYTAVVFNAVLQAKSAFAAPVAPEGFPQEVVTPSIEDIIANGSYLDGWSTVSGKITSGAYNSKLDTGHYIKDQALKLVNAGTGHIVYVNGTALVAGNTIDSVQLTVQDNGIVIGNEVKGTVANNYGGMHKGVLQLWKGSQAFNTRVLANGSMSLQNGAKAMQQL